MSRGIGSVSGIQRGKTNNQDLCTGAVILVALWDLIIVTLLVLDGFLKFDLLIPMCPLFLPIYQILLTNSFLKILLIFPFLLCIKFLMCSPFLFTCPFLVICFFLKISTNPWFSL